LINGGEIIAIVGLAWLTIPIMALSRLIFYKNLDVYKYESRWRWEMLVKGFVLVYMQVLITSLLNIINPKFDTTINYFSYILSFFGLAFCIAGYAGITAMTVWFHCLPKWKQEEWKFINLF